MYDYYFRNKIVGKTLYYVIDSNGLDYTGNKNIFSKIKTIEEALEIGKAAPNTYIIEEIFELHKHNRYNNEKYEYNFIIIYQDKFWTNNLVHENGIDMQITEIETDQYVNKKYPKIEITLRNYEKIVLKSFLYMSPTSQDTLDGKHEISNKPGISGIAEGIKQFNICKKASSVEEYLLIKQFKSMDDYVKFKKYKEFDSKLNELKKSWDEIFESKEYTKDLEEAEKLLSSLIIRLDEFKLSE
jgi:hypothetical protein